MPYQIPPDVENMIAARIARGEYRSEAEVLRSALAALEESESDLATIQTAVDAWRAGDEGIPLGDAIQAIRNRSSSGQPT